VDIVLGVSLAPDSVQMVLLQGENADGATVDEKEFAVIAAGDSPTVSASDRAIAAILGTRDDAAGAGLELSAVGVACTDQLEAKALGDALAAHKLANVMLVSAFLAATSLAQSVGGAMGYERTAVLFVEPGTATLAVVETSDGSVADVHKEQLHGTSAEAATAELMEMVAGLDALSTRPGGLFVVGSGVDVAAIKAHLEEATSLSVSAAEEPETALAWGAALASANAPLFASSTAALAYAQDPGTGEVDRYAVSPGYLEVPVHRAGARLREEDLAYSAAPDQDADEQTGIVNIAESAALDDFEASPRPRPMLLVGSALAVVVVSAALALEIALALGIRPAVALRPTPGQALIAPAEVAPAPPAAPLLPVPHPPAVHAAPPPLHLPAPAPIAPAPVPIPAAPVPVPVRVPMHAWIPAPPVRVPFDQPRMNLAVPRPLLRAPSPPGRMPLMREPAPQMRTPFPPFRGQIPQPPMNFPAPEGPRFPESPRFPDGPRFPMMPGPRFPSMPGPMMPRMPVLPHFNFPVPLFRF